VERSKKDIQRGYSGHAWIVKYNFEIKRNDSLGTKM